VYCGPRYWLRSYEKAFVAGLVDVDLGEREVLTLTAPGSDVLPDRLSLAGLVNRCQGFYVRFLSNVSLSRYDEGRSVLKASRWRWRGDVERPQSDVARARSILGCRVG
jgi:hypothetical protein